MKGKQTQRSLPPRLSHEEYFPQQVSPMRVYHQVAREPVGVHWHEFYEVSFILQGQGTHLLNGRAHQLVPGSFFLLTPTDLHALIPQPYQPLELFNVIFAEEMLCSEIRHILFKTPGELHIQMSEAIRPVIEREFRCLWTEAEEQQVGYQVVIRGALERILIALGRSLPILSAYAASGESTVSQPIRQALIYMQHLFREPLSLTTVAYQAGLSSHYFSECFRKETGQTFQKYMQDLRLRFAQSLLNSSQLPVTTICLSAGFTTLIHFERVFKRRFGLPPYAYQQRCARQSNKE
jgi:AraC-like DNA-binding protein